MANVTRNRPGGCGCRQALNNGVTYANMNYAASETSDWPFYNGPCPGTRPINGCPGWCRGTNGLPCGALGGGPAAQAYGFFSHVGALSLAAGSGVPFNGPSQAQGMAQDYTQIRIEQAGLYLVEYRLTWPVAAVTNARFTLLANGERVRDLTGVMGLVSHVHISRPGMAPVEPDPIDRELALLLGAVGYKGFVSLEMKAAEPQVLRRSLEYVAEVFG